MSVPANGAVILTVSGATMVAFAVAASAQAHTSVRASRSAVKTDSFVFMGMFLSVWMPYGYSTDLSASTMSIERTLRVSSSWMKTEKQNVMTHAMTTDCTVGTPG